VLLGVCAAALAIASDPAPGAQARGSISGHARLMGLATANPIVRMGMDPACAAANSGKRIVKVSTDGGLSNVFVWLDANLPAPLVPTQAVVIDQTACMYAPRVVGARVGQSVQFKNSDHTLHNVHGVSTKGNDFNMSEPAVGMVVTVTLKHPEVMLRIKCDIHGWMTSYVGVVPTPYFAVTGDAGRFEIPNVPPGTYTLRAWHEQYGTSAQMVQVKGGAVASVDFTFKGSAKR
jgi:plastocyanin